MKRVRVLAIAILGAAAAVGAGVAPAGATNQIFGTTQGGNWVIGSYDRDGTNASLPSTTYSTSGNESYVSRGNQGGFGYPSIARLSVGFGSGPCARALGSGAGAWAGDAYCSAY